MKMGNQDVGRQNNLNLTKKGWKSMKMGNQDVGRQNNLNLN